MDQKNNKQKDTSSSEQNPMLTVKTAVPPTKKEFSEVKSSKNERKESD